MTQRLKAIYGILSVLFLAYGLFYLARYIFHLYRSLPDPLQASIIAAVSTVLVTAGPLVYSNIKARQREIEQTLYEKKQPIYDKLLVFLFEVLKKSKTNESMSEEETITFFISFSRDLMLWGSDEVVVAYINWQKVTASEETSAIQKLLALEDLILRIRSDFGHRNRGLSKGDLLSLIITDAREILEEGTQD